MPTMKIIANIVKINLRIVAACGHVSTGAGPVCVDEFPFLAENLIGVGAEEVALSLQQVGRQSLRPIAIIKSQSG